MGHIQKVELNFHQVHVVFKVTTYYTCTRKNLFCVVPNVILDNFIHYLKPVLCFTKFCFQKFSLLHPS